MGQIKKEGSKESSDILFIGLFIGTAYLSPIENYKNNSVELFLYELRHFKEKGVVFVQGDFNAYTGNLPDYLVKDKTDEPFGIADEDMPLQRNSEDIKALNNRGKTLL